MAQTELTVLWCACLGGQRMDERGPGKTAFYPLTVREDSKLTVITVSVKRPGGARGLHRPGEEVAGVGRLTNPT